MLDELELTETKNHQKYWTDIGRGAFCATVRESTKLQWVRINFTRQDEEINETFREQIMFFTHQKVKEKKR